MEWHRTIHFTMHELVDIFFVRCADLIRRTLGHDYALVHEIYIVHDLQGFLYIVGDNY